MSAGQGRPSSFKATFSEDVPVQVLAQDAEADGRDEGSVSDGAASLLSIAVKRKRQRAGAFVPRSPTGLLDYWARLRGERRFPAPEQIEGTAIAAYATRALLVRCQADGRLLRVEKVYSMPSTIAVAASDLQISDLRSAIILDWLGSLGRQAAASGKPVQDVQTLTANRAETPWRAVVLPLSAGGTELDHFLCCLRAETSAA